VISDEGYLDATLKEHVRRASTGGPRQQRAVLDRIAMLAATNLSGVDHAGLTLVIDGKVIHCLAATDVNPLVLDNIQRGCGQGPCFDLLTERGPLRVDDLSVESRWPLFTAKAIASTPVRAILAQSVFHDRRSCAVFTLYGNTRHAFDARTVVDCSLFVSRLAEVMAATQRRRMPAKATASNAVKEAT
jgi:ribosomal protein S26